MVWTLFFLPRRKIHHKLSFETWEAVNVGKLLVQVTLLEEVLTNISRKVANICKWPLMPEMKQRVRFAVMNKMHLRDSTC